MNDYLQSFGIKFLLKFHRKRFGPVRTFEDIVDTSIEKCCELNVRLQNRFQYSRERTVQSLQQRANRISPRRVRVLRPLGAAAPRRLAHVPRLRDLRGAGRRRHVGRRRFGCGRLRGQAARRAAVPHGSLSASWLAGWDTG